MADVYEHKHKPLSADCASQGLHRMAVEVGAALVRRRRVRRARARSPRLRGAARIALSAARRRSCCPRYRADARLNGLAFDDACEQQAISRVRRRHWPRRARWPARLQSTGLAAWREVEQVFPRVLDRLRDLADELDVLKPATAHVPVRTRVGRLLARRPRPPGLPHQLCQPRTSRNIGTWRSVMRRPGPARHPGRRRRSRPYRQALPPGFATDARSPCCSAASCCSRSRVVASGRVPARDPPTTRRRRDRARPSVRAR